MPAKAEPPPLKPVDWRAASPRNANEIFGSLYGANVSARAMIQAFSSIRMRFRSRAAAIFLKDNGHFVRFDLPVKYWSGQWLPPSAMSEADIQEMVELYAAVAGGRSADSRSIVDLAHRRGAADRWALLFSCTMRPAQASASKRTTGDIKIILHNEGHLHRCVYEADVKADPSTDRIVARAAVEDHDLIAVYAAYFDQMLRDLSFVPMPLIQAEWNKALNNLARSNEGHTRHSAGLPWGAGAPSETPTITLSLDLRKSTFAMQQTRDRRAYAHWLEGVAELARTITLQNGGIFDKFTGDGVICHFVFPDDADGAADDAMRAAMVCASELIHAIQLHIGNVMSLLKFKSRAFGPAVGMAVDMAAWSLDRDGKPVVVGPGIVNACRLNGGRAGDIVLTNDLKDRVASLIRNLKFEEHDLGDTHKDFSAQLEAMCWRLPGAAMRLGRSTIEIQAEVEQVSLEIRRTATP